MKKLAVLIAAMTTPMAHAVPATSHKIIGELEWSYYRNGETISIQGVSRTDGTALSGDIVIPSKIDDCPVIQFADKTFQRKNISSVSIPEGVTGIPGEAFINCSSLVSVHLPGSMETIGGYAFYGCSSLASVSIPSNVTYIAPFAFSGCESLSSVHINDLKAWCQITFGSSSGIDVGCETSNPLFYAHRLFLDGEEISRLVVPEGTANIGIFAFVNCTNIVSVTVPGSVQGIGAAAFAGCSGLQSMTVPFVGTQRGRPGLGKKGYNFGFVFGRTETDGMAPARQPYDDGYNRKDFFLPTNLLSVTITDETEASQYAFVNCWMLKDISINEGVAGIREYAFADCTGLEDFTIPATVESIGQYAFQNCSSLKAVHLNSNDINISIDSTAFSGCPASLFDTTSKPGLTLLDGCVVAVDPSVSGVVDLTGTRGPTRNAFKGNKRITGVILPAGMEVVPADAFNGCTALAGVEIPEGVTSIGERAFLDCPNLPRIEIASGNPAYRSIGGILFTKDRRTLLRAPGGWYGNAVLNENVREIAPGAFEGRWRMLGATIPATVTAIAERTFAGCAGLAEIVMGGDAIPEDAEHIGADAFSGVPATMVIRVRPEATGWGSTWAGFRVRLDIDETVLCRGHQPDKCGGGVPRRNLVEGWNAGNLVGAGTCAGRGRKAGLL